ncbi:MAG: alpha-amylase, partial [Oscillospiraceae bacterium]|nr:alpha-amylase [Oscillospiraceae bacterium]
MNSELLRFYDFVSSQEDDQILSIPKVWNDSIQNPYVERDKNTVKVNIISFYKNLIDKFLNSKDNIDKDDFFDPSTSVIYCAVPRYSAAFDIYDSGKFSDGTFIRMLMLLPMLKNMGVNVLYLLPVNKHSNLFLKGDIGSPFSIVSFYELDPDLHDQIVEDIE